jgi:hypothetical protein
MPLSQRMQCGVNSRKHLATKHYGGKDSIFYGFLQAFKHFLFYLISWSTDLTPNQTD